MDYLILYIFILTYYILGFFYFFYITNNKTNSFKDRNFQINNDNNITRNLLMEAQF